MAQEDQELERSEMEDQEKQTVKVDGVYDGGDGEQTGDGVVDGGDGTLGGEGGELGDGVVGSEGTTTGG